MATNYRKLPTLSEQDIKRFWSKVRILEPDECWEWQASADKDGYGWFGAQGQANWRTHRIAYLIQHGVDPLDDCVLHRCDNPPCCNGAHLFLGTVIDNNRDMFLKGRHARGDRQGRRLYPERYPSGKDHPARKHPERMARGSKHGCAKITEEIVREIRRRHAEGSATNRQMASDYDISAAMIGYIVNRHNWVHI